MRRDQQRLEDIIEALESVRKMTSGLTEEEFLDNEMLRYAVAQRLTVVGEACSRVSAELKLRTPHIP